MNKKLIASTVLIALMFVAIYGTSDIDVVSKDDKEEPGFVKSFSNKFNLDEEEVGSFIQEIRADRFADMQSNFEDRLSLAVENGEMTLAQKQDLLDLTGMQWAEIDFFNNLTVEEKSDMLTEFSDQLKIWVDENGLDRSLIA